MSAGTLPTDTPEREHARAVIVTEIDRLHWRIWNGKAKDAQITLEDPSKNNLNTLSGFLTFRV